MRTILIYIILVGLPIAGLYGILHIGERLEAPLFVGGAWRISDEFVQTLQLYCGEKKENRALLQLPEEEAELTISQSGQYLALSFNDAERTTFMARLHQQTLRAEGQKLISGEKNGPGTPATVFFEASFVRQKGSPDCLEGIWRLPGCPVIPFQAFRRNNSNHQD
jgi:hypothetical protein